MKIVTIAALVAAQLLTTAAPIRAAELPNESSMTQSQRGTFGGARLRVPFGGEESGKVRAGIGLAPVARADLADGRSRTHFGEGVELSLNEGEAPALHVGGAAVSQRLAATEEDEEKKRDSTGDKVLKGAAVVLGVGALAMGALLVAIFVN